MVYDSRCVGKSQWAGVILRNVPKNSEPYKIKDNLENVLYKAIKLPTDDETQPDQYHQKNTKKDETDLIPPISIKVLHVQEKVEIKK